MNNNDSNFLYCKDRCINIPLFLLTEYKEIDTLIEVLLILYKKKYNFLDYNKEHRSNKNKYDNINLSAFFNDAGINISHPNDMKYCLRRYCEISRTEQEFLKNKEMWDIPHINLISNKTNNGKLL